MEQTFSRNQLVSFGLYLLSEERKNIFAQNPNYPNGEQLEERLSQVHRADVENFIASKKLFRSLLN